MTPTREQALTPAELRELCAQLSEDGQAMLHRAVHAAHMSGLELGRDQGLREAGTACETQSLNKMHADLKSIARKHWRAFHETSHAKWQGMAMAYEQAAIKCKRAAAAIEQLRRPRAT